MGQMKFKDLPKQYYVLQAGLFISTCAFVFPLLHHFIYVYGSCYDYSLHDALSFDMWQQKRILVPHFLYHGLVVVGLFLGLTLQRSCLIVSLVGFALVPVILYHYFCQGKVSLFAAMIAFLTTIASHILILLLFEPGAYLGYIPLNAIHSPTMTVMKPFALLNFFIMIRNLNHREVSLNAHAAAILTLVLATLAKPNYTMAVVPAAVVYALLRSVKGYETGWRALIVDLVLPSVVLLAWQYWFNYLTPTTHMAIYKESAHIIIAPFLALRTVSDLLVLKLFFSITFPLAVLLLYRKEVRNSPGYLLALFTFAFGFLTLVLLAETGEYLPHLRFLWGASIGSFLWFIVSIKFFLFDRQRGSRLTLRSGACYSILALHFLFGIAGFGNALIPLL
jgi:hypothetical protein